MRYYEQGYRVETENSEDKETTLITGNKEASQMF
jgi:hypothetical protein